MAQREEVLGVPLFLLSLSLSLLFFLLVDISPLLVHFVFFLEVWGTRFCSPGRGLSRYVFNTKLAFPQFGKGKYVGPDLFFWLLLVSSAPGFS